MLISELGPLPLSSAKLCARDAPHQDFLIAEARRSGKILPMPKIAYDPRDVFQRPHKPETWRLTDNPVLLRAARARGPKTAEYWRRVAILAEIHDATQDGLRVL